MRHILALAFTLTLAATATKAGAKPEGQKPIYAFGYSTCLSDSTTYLTPIQVIPGATLDKKTKFLNDRQAFTHQLKSYIESRYSGHQTSVLVFSDSRKKLENKFIKMRRTLVKSKDTKLVELEAGAFRFATNTAEAE